MFSFQKVAEFNFTQGIKQCSCLEIANESTHNRKGEKQLVHCLLFERVIIQRMIIEGNKYTVFQCIPHNVYVSQPKVIYNVHYVIKLNYSKYFELL